jgi:hypothetical protein
VSSECINRWRNYGLIAEEDAKCERLPAYWRKLLAELLDAIVTTVSDVDVARGIYGHS